MTTLPANAWTRNIGLFAVLFALVVVAVAGAVRNRGLSQRVEDLENRLAELEATAGPPTARRSASGGSRHRPFSRALETSLDLDGGEFAESLAAPEARQMIEEVVADYSVAEREERRLRREEHVNDRVSELADAFAADQGLDDDTAQQLIQVLLDGAAERHELRAAMMDGDLDAEAMREERERVAAETDERLVELLGEETFDALQAEMENLRFGPR